METLKVWFYDKLGVQPKKKDGFESQGEGMSFTTAIVYILLVLTVLFIYSYGAAKLSWCYNSSMGTGAGLKFLYSLLAFFFSSFYYPFYALFLDDNCQVGAIANNQTGGGRKHKSRS